MNRPADTNAAWLAARKQHVPRGIGSAFPIIVSHAEGTELFDVEGRRYLDFAGGIGVLNVGHRHPRVVEAIHAQVDKVLHTSFQVAAYPPYIELAERLNRAVPIAGDCQTIFFSTGAEATENVVKIARVATGRRGIITFTGAFHGRSLMALALTGKTLPYKQAFGPLPGAVFHAPFPIALHGVTVQDTLDSIDHIFRADLAPQDVAAIIIEPVQGEGGFYPAPPELLRALRDLCDEHGILFVSDEVQAGFGRTGRLFAIEHTDVEPDLVCCAKSLAAGMPLSAVTGKHAIMDSVDPGGLGGTYSGNPVACAAALAVMDVMEEERLLDASARQGEQLVARLEALRQVHPSIAEVRALGGMVAIELMQDGAPAAALTKAVSHEALSRGLVLLSCGYYGNVLRFLAPLTSTPEQIDEGLDIVAQSLAAVEA